MSGRRVSLEKFTPRTFNMGFRRKVYDKVGGFREMFSEDIDMSTRYHLDVDHGGRLAAHADYLAGNLHGRVAEEEHMELLVVEVFETLAHHLISHPRRGDGVLRAGDGVPEGAASELEGTGDEDGLGYAYTLVAAHDFARVHAGEAPEMPLVVPDDFLGHVEHRAACRARAEEQRQ